MNSISSDTRRKWLVCAGCTLLLFIGTGLNVNVFTVVQPYVLSLNGFTNTQVSMLQTIRSAANLAAILLIEPFFRLLGYRKGCAAAALIPVLSLLAYAFAGSYAAYAFAAVLSGLGFGLASVVPVTILLTGWFGEKKGAALGIATASTGFATVIFSPILTSMIENCSLRVCFLFEAALCMAGTILIFLFVRECPEMPETPWKNAETIPPSEEEPLPGWGRALLYVSILLIGAPVTTAFNYIGTLYSTSGVDGVKVSAAVSVMGFCLAVGKWVFGVLRDRFGTLPMTAAYGALLLAGLVLCTMAGKTGDALMYTAMVLFGTGAGIGMIGMPLWAGDLSSPALFPARLRRLQFCYTASTLIWALLPGILADLTGSYRPAFGVFCVLAVTALAVILLLYRVRRRGTEPDFPNRRGRTL